MDKLEEELRAALAKAYIAGATDVHVYWRAGGSDTEPDFAEAAHDYAVDHIDASAVIARKQVEELEAAVSNAAEVFEQYARLHLAKGTPDGNAKADRNMRLALEMRAALHRKGVEPK